MREADNGRYYRERNHGRKEIQSGSSTDRENKLYGVEEAIGLAKKTARTKFDETVDLAVNLGVDPKQADQMVRGTVVLPHGTGKKVKVLVFARVRRKRKHGMAGADYVGAEDLADKIQKEGWTDSRHGRCHAGYHGTRRKAR